MWLFLSILVLWFAISLLVAVIVGPVLKRRGEMTSDADASTHPVRQRAREAA